MDMLKDNLVFLRETIQQFHNTGAICSTSRWAAEAMTDPIRHRGLPQRILELGPGTGSVTMKILEDMMDGDTLAICEINPRFMSALKKKLETNEHFLRHKDHITFFECPAQDLPENACYDVIICSLPFLNFDLKTVKEIFRKLKSISTEKTVMTYYQYMGIRSLSRVVSAPERKKRMSDLDTFFDNVHQKYSTARKRVWLNLLPINIYTVGCLNTFAI